MTVAIFLLTHLGPHTTRLTSALFFVVFGVGMGFLMQITSLIAQNSVQQKDMGVASSSGRSSSRSAARWASRCSA